MLASGADDEQRHGGRQIVDGFSGAGVDEAVLFGHVGDRCSFDAIIRIYGIEDLALDRLATIVRGSDTSRPDLAPQCPGLNALSHGLSANFSDDHEQLKYGMVMYDALYAWCRAADSAKQH